MMQKFRRKPEVIEAEQFWPDKKPWPRGVIERKHQHDTAGKHHRVRTRFEGWLTVDPGDWIVKCKDGSLYPYKADYFEQTYEPIKDEPNEGKKGGRNDPFFGSGTTRKVAGELPSNYVGIEAGKH